jgi:hypothetical protein
MNAQVKQFIETVKKNASKVWTDSEDEDFINSLLYVHSLPDGSVSISCNHEKYFNTIYRVDTSGNWFVRHAYCNKAEQPYCYEQAMIDAEKLHAYALPGTGIYRRRPLKDKTKEFIESTRVWFTSQ